MNRIKLGFTLMTISVGTLAYTHKVKKGQTLSQIAASEIGLPIWGKNGSLAKIKALNPWIKNLNQIYPNSEIILSEERHSTPVEEVATLSDMVEETNSKIKPMEIAEEKMHSFSLIPFYSALSVEAQDIQNKTTALIASQYFIGIEGRYNQHWSEDFKSYIQFNIGTISFEPSSGSSKSLSDKNKLITGLGIGGIYSLTEKVRITGMANFQKELFIRAESTSNIALDTILVPSLGTRLEYDLYQKKIFTFGLAGVFEEKFSAKADSYNIKTGQKVGGSIYLRHASKDPFKYYQTELGYSQRSQDTKISTQEEKNLILSFQYNF